MTPARLRQVAAVFEAVLELPQERWPDALSEACGADDALRREVAALLAHSVSAGPFLERSPVGSVAQAWPPDDPDAWVGRQLGQYQLVERIALGGMGAVYRGLRADGEFEQEVAVKVVKRGLDSAGLLERFRRERQTLARLSHPNVARLLDGGVCPDGQPYLVMEFVAGRPIDEFCDERAMSTAERLRLFVHVCDAVCYAHRNLVVHRDLKPGNVLVTLDGEPKLLDFGIAKVLADREADAAGQTVAAERRLTPEYASPEQVEGGAVTTATDVYSLGVILYELLSGHRPYRFTSRTTGEIQRVICHESPPPPSTAVVRANGVGAPVAAGTDTAALCARRGETTPQRLRRRLRGDLDNIVLTAMRKEPDRRYASVEALAADIRRHLDGLPVLARKDTLAYRTQKFVRRHAAVTCAAALLFVTLVASVAFVSRAARLAATQRDAAYVARDQAEEVADFLQRMLATADPLNSGADARIRPFLDVAAQTIDVELTDRPLVQAAVRSTIGKTYLRLGLLELAEAHIRRAFETREQLLPRGHHDLAESRFDLAEMMYSRGCYLEAEALLRESLAMHTALRGPENVDTARVMNDLGAVLRAAGKLDEAELVHRLALQIRERSRPAQDLPVAESLNNLSGVLAQRGDVAGALDCAARAWEIRTRCLPPDHPFVAQAAATLAVMLFHNGELGAAEDAARQSVALIEACYPAGTAQRAAAYQTLGGVLFATGRDSEAEPLLRAAFQVYALRLEPSDGHVRNARLTLGRCLARLGRDEEAEALLVACLAPLEAKAVAPSAALLAGVDELIELYERTNRPALAERYRALIARSSPAAPQGAP